MTCPSSSDQMTCNDTSSPTAVWARYDKTFQQIRPSEYRNLHMRSLQFHRQPIFHCQIIRSDSHFLKRFPTSLSFSGISIIHVLRTPEYLVWTLPSSLLAAFDKTLFLSQPSASHSKWVPKFKSWNISDLCCCFLAHEPYNKSDPCCHVLILFVFSECGMESMPQLL